MSCVAMPNELLDVVVAGLLSMLMHTAKSLSVRTAFRFAALLQLVRIGREGMTVALKAEIHTVRIAVVRALPGIIAPSASLSPARFAWSASMTESGEPCCPARRNSHSKRDDEPASREEKLAAKPNAAGAAPDFR